MTFTPTHVDHTPAVCYCCGRHAIGLGIGNTDKGGDPKYLCGECVLLAEQIRHIKRMDPYELQARKGGMDAAAPLVDEFGLDLSEWTEEQVLMFCGAIWKGCGDRLRHLVRMGEAPF